MPRPITRRIIENDPVTGPALRSANSMDRIALRGVRLQCSLTALCERTTVEQTFVNLEDKPIEAVYTFPLPDEAAVCEFEVITGDRVLTGTAEESDTALQTYDEAVADGHGAFLLEQERPDIFSVRAGNLKPGQAATIRFGYVRPLARAGREIRVSFPTTVAPRYVTNSGGRDPMEATIDGDAVNPPHVPFVPYGLSLGVNIDMGRAVKAVTSPSHEIRLQKTSETEVSVTLDGGVAEMNRDIVLLLEMQNEDKPVVQIGKWKDSDQFLAVTFTPEFEVSELHPPEPEEVIFVLDCSGCMEGNSMEQATAALELCLRSLSEGDTFNICRFGDTFDLMFPEAVVYSARTLRQALKEIRWHASLGGTELLEPLKTILEMPVRAGAARQIILLTDGQISNEREVIELARNHRTTNRIFTFGIGASASSHLVNSLSRVTGGTAEFIAPGEPIDDKVLRLFGRIASPQVSDMELICEGCELQAAPIPPVFDGDSLSFYARLSGNVPHDLTIRCKTPQGRKEWTLPLKPSGNDKGAIALMWARRAIEELEDVETLRRPVLSKFSPNRNTSTIVRLSKKFGILCSLTTFVAVEHRSIDERNAGQPELRRVPAMIPQGWGGTRELLSMPCASALSFPDPAAFNVAPTARKSLLEIPSFFKSKKTSEASKAPAGSMISDDSVTTLKHLLACQSAEGSFELTPELTRLLARCSPPGLFQSGEAAGQDLQSMAGGRVVSPEAANTAWAIVVLRWSFSAHSQLWRRATLKAIRYLASTLRVDVSQIERWIESFSGNLGTHLV